MSLTDDTEMFQEEGTDVRISFRDKTNPDVDNVSEVYAPVMGIGYLLVLNRGRCWVNSQS